MAERTTGTSKQCSEELENGDLIHQKVCMGLAVMAYCFLLHEPTGFSPLRLLYGRELHTPADIEKYHYTRIGSYKQAASKQTSMMIELFTTAL